MKIMLIGSSIFEQWYNYKIAFPGFSVVNRAIGGTQTVDWLQKDLVPILKEEIPDIVIMYCGSNDMWELEEDVTKTNVLKIREIIYKFNKNIKFSYFSIIKSLSKKEIWNKVDRVNKYIEENLNSSDYFYNINNIFFENGKLIEDLFTEDGTHHPNKAYDKLVVNLMPKISKWLNC